MLLSRQRQGVSCRLSPGYNRDQVYFIAAFQQMADDGMSALVNGHHAAVFFVHLMALLFGTHLYPGNGVDQQLLVNLFLPGTGCEDSGFVHHVFQVSAGSVRHTLRDIIQVHAVIQLLALAVNFQDGHAAVLVRIVDRHLPVKTAGTHQGGVKDIAAVGCGHHDNAFIHGKTVHFNQQLVQCLFTFIVAAAEACAAVTSNCVNFIDKYDGRSHLLGLVKQVADAACADADKHLHKVTAADGEEGYACFARNSFGQQGFTGSGRSNEQNALGYPGAQFRIVPGILQEVHHLLEFFLLFIRAGHVCKGNLVLRGILHPGTALAEGHHLSAAARLGADHHKPYDCHNTQHDQVRQEIIPPRNHNRGTVFQVKRQLVHRNLIQRYVLFIGFNLADSVQEVRTDCGFKIVVAFREIVRRHIGGFGHTNQGIVSDGNSGYLAFFDHIQQLRIFDPAADRLAQAAVQQDGNQQQRGKKYNVPDDTP